MATIFGPYYLGFVACQRTVNNKEINLKHSQIAETREYGEKWKSILYEIVCA